MAKKVMAPVIMATAYEYMRYSSHSQREESIEQQQAEIHKFAAEQNLQIIGSYSDAAVTGRTDQRPQFQRMMRDAKKYHPQYIIAYKSNRIARNMLNALSTENELECYGVRVLYVKETFGDNAAGRFALRTMMNVNQFYSENMAEDIKRGLKDNAENCKITNGQLPLGYKKGDDGKYILDENEAAAVREIFSRFACGDALADIARDFNARQVKTRRGKEWGKNSFHRILSNERYTGVYIYCDVRVEGGVPQIIGKELFCKVQEMLTTKKSAQGRHRANGDYLLTGKLFCGRCKSPMVGKSGTGKNGTLHHYYTCNKRIIDKSCDKDSVRRDWIETEVAAAVKQHVLNDDIIAWIADSTIDYAKSYKDKSQISVLEKQLTENKRATKNLLSAIEQGIITTTTKERLMELEGEQSKITTRIALEKSEIPNISREQIVAWLESFKDGAVEDKEYQANLFSAFVVSVFLYDDHLKIVFGFAGKNNTITIPIDIDGVGVDKSNKGSYKISYAPPIQLKSSSCST